MLYGHCLQSHERTSDRALREASKEKAIHKQVMVQRCQDTVSYSRSILRYNFISLSYNRADVGGSLGWRDSSAPQGHSGTQFCSIPLLCSIVLVGIVFNYMVKTWSLPHECSSLWEGQRKDGGTCNRCFEAQTQKWLTYPGGCSLVIWSHLVTKHAGKCSL